ncbi:precorrin-4 C(11)-methyltransferase [Parabacteroides distasonis]|uniref:precorrin-4 C(11)-methyltransferase n=1 Tax=Parabacteroides distasonis TaxID=823 RepID=UPI0018AA0088|nr:precorrin-4 C(11)-methyltransferase [Parabacteroides distasonis]
MSTISIIPISDSSRVLAERILASYPEAKILPFGSFSKEVFHESSSLVFIGAMGICVRSIAPFAEDKHTDPAVVCIDSTGKYVIPVLSGHIGGANDLSKELANLLGAEAIITTQSDNTNLWPLDTLGKKYDWTLIAKDSNAAISTFVNGKPTALLLDIRDKGTDYLERTVPSHVSIFYSFEAIPQQDYELLMIVSPQQYDTSIPTITYIPKVLHLGMGCRKDMQGDPTVVYEHIKDVLRDKRLYPEALADVNTIDLKKCEPVLTLLAYGVMECPFHTYTSEELKDIPVPNPSEKVLEVTESSSVSEASAIYAAHGGPLLVEKQKADLGKGNEYTFAVALDRAACRKGHIEIVGAGPGDPDLISIRGRQMLEKADLILYAGSLVPKELTLCAKAGATVRSSADMNLEEQFALMKEFYDKGLFVVRLHTGDPCIYGAIQEQMNYFDQYGMDYHITPGISSFQAAAAALYSQFTIPEKVQTIILTRGEGRTPMPEKEQLHKLAQSQSTMCIFLSAGVVEKVQEELSRHYAPTTPVAACYKLTWKDERIYRGQLKDLAKIVKENHLTLTTLLVVGDAIDNRKGLSRLYADEFKHLFRK